MDRTRADVAVGDVAAPDPTTAPERRTPLSKPLVVSTAVALVERSGLASLSMRKLGVALGVEAMSLYRYVPGRSELLDEMVDFLIDRVTQDADVVEASSAGWQDYVQRLAHGVRAVALQYPNCFPLVASRPPEAPWLRPPLRSIEWVEMFLAGLSSAGFSDEAAVRAYRAFSSFLLGHLLLEVAALGADVGPMDFLVTDAEADGSASGAFALAELPMIKRMRAKLSEDHAAVEFEESLENLLERIAQTRSEHDPA